MERIMFDIEKFLDLTSYEVTRKDRRKGSKSTQEFFTPYSIVKRMCDKVSDEDWSDPNKTFLEPSAGSGQFVIYIVWNRLQHGIDWKTALKTCYSVELMHDNVDEMKERVHKMLSQICPDYNKASATRIMNKNFVCHDFFTWNFEEWRPMTEEEIKNAKKKK
jgi:ribosomal protein L11 methylase PrmA